MKTALVTGISGQDGAYLAKLLLEKGYEVWGTSRDAQVSSFRNLERISVRDDVRLASVALNDFRSVIQVLFKAQPDEIYNLAGQRDWGWAPEYVEAMYLMLQQPEPEDYVIATGQTRKLQDFVEAAFRTVGLDWGKHTITDKSFYRPTEIMIGRGDARKAEQKLGWKAKYKMDDVARMMVEAVREG